MKLHAWQPAFNLKASWENIEVEYSCLDEVGEFDFAMPPQAISVAFLLHERVTWSVDGSSNSNSLPAGSAFIYGDRNFVWHNRERASENINILLEPKFLEQVAIENGFSAPVELQHRVIFLDPTILHVAQLFKAELLHSGVAGRLYVESLRNLLAVHLLRNYNVVTAAKPVLIDGALDKVVLITGATSGIGEGTAYAFAREGAKVFFCGRRENLGKQVEAKIKSFGGEATYMQADVRKEADIKALVDTCVNKYGRTDIAFNNAGIESSPKAIADQSLEIGQT